MRLVRGIIRRLALARVKADRPRQADSPVVAHDWPICGHIGGKSNAELDALIRADAERTRVRRR